MKTNFREIALGLSLTSLLMGVGCEGNQAGGNAPLVANVAPAITAEPAEPAAKPALQPAAPTEAPVPVVKNEPPAPPAQPVALVAPAAPTTPVAAPAAPVANTAPAPTNIVPTVPPPNAPTISPALAEVVRLLQANVSQDIVMAYVTNSSQPFFLSASEIVYLNDLGAPSAVLTALITVDASPEMAARKQAASAVKPLPAGVAIHSPAPNVLARGTATAAVQNPPEPVPVNPPANQNTALSPPPPQATVTYDYPPPGEVTYDYFYSSLSPYGSWIDAPGYGSVWRPTCATWNSSWRPYSDNGRWLWSNAGWYWYSDYSWGWAPFHYGRWCQPSGLGWVWQPDTVWGSSWVSWRYSSSYCGWAPLPPAARYVSGLGFYYNSGSVGIGFEFGLGAADYCYVPSARFCDRRPWHHTVPHHQKDTIHKETTIVNNYIVGNNNTIINNGAGLDTMSKVTRGDVKQVALKDTTSVKNLGNRHDRLETDGKTLSVYRPPTSTLARRSVVSAPAPAVTAAPRSGGTAVYSKPAVTVSGSSFARPATAVNSSAPANTVKNHAPVYTSQPIMSSRSGATPVTVYTKPANAASQPVTVTGGTVPDATYTKPAGATGSGIPSRANHSTVSAGADQSSKTTPGYTRPSAVSGNRVSSVPAGTDPLKSAYTPRVGSSAGTGPSAAKIGQARTEPSRAYVQPSAPRSPVTQLPAQNYVRPAPSAPSQNYSRPAPSQNYSAPARSQPNHSRVTAPSGGGQSGGSSVRSSGNPSSSGGNADGKNGR